MQVQKQMEREQEADMNNLFVEDFKRAIESLYKKHLSEAIKRGIRAKKLQKAL